MEQIKSIDKILMDTLVFSNDLLDKKVQYAIKHLILMASMEDKDFAQKGKLLAGLIAMNLQQGPEDFLRNIS